MQIRIWNYLGIYRNVYKCWLWQVKQFEIPGALPLDLLGQKPTSCHGYYISDFIT